MTLTDFLHSLKTTPDVIDFDDTIKVIEQHYHFTPTEFTNGKLHNAAGENSGSCKLFAFAQLQNLDEQQTLHCFGRYYRDDVLQNPQADNHQNIRNFMCSGWGGITFSGSALATK